MGVAWRGLIVVIAGVLAVPVLAASKATKPKAAHVGGYLIARLQPVPQTYGAGFSFYSAAWPLLLHYPDHRFQSGLFGTWMFASNKDFPKGHYTDLEGSLGWWRGTRFPTVTPKFSLGAVGLNFHEIAAGPSAGKGGWNPPKGRYGTAQLSPWLLFPMDGLVLKPGTNGQLFGYGYLALPLTDPQPRTDGKQVPTGDHSWTLFLNTKNFKGPVCFVTPHFWAHSSLENPAVQGKMLDSRPCRANKPFQMETQFVPAWVTGNEPGAYARVQQMSFPVGAKGYTVVMNRSTVYSKKALWDGVKRWFDGGPAVSGKINASGECVQEFKDGGWGTWAIDVNGAAKDKRFQIPWKSMGTAFAPDPMTYAYKWNRRVVRQVNSPDGPRILLPQYYQLKPDGKKLRWQPVPAKQVPAAAGLSHVTFGPGNQHDRPAYKTPDDPNSLFEKPGPAAGPFYAHLSDGSVVTYYWYKFENQPALLHADLSQSERDKMQARVEKLQRVWTKDRQYLAPPTTGTLGSLDPAQIVTPPKGLEIGYVPIATRQTWDTRGRAGK